MDLIHDLSYQLPVIVIAEMLGIPANERAQFKPWSDEVVVSADKMLCSAEMPRNPAVFTDECVFPRRHW